MVLLLLERERARGGTPGSEQGTPPEPVSPLPLSFLDHRYSLDPALDPGARAIQRLLVFLNQVEHLLQEDLANLAEPREESFASAKASDQRNDLDAIQRLSLAVQHTVTCTFAEMRTQMSCTTADHETRPDGMK